MSEIDTLSMFFVYKNCYKNPFKKKKKFYQAAKNPDPYSKSIIAKTINVRKIWDASTSKLASASLVEKPETRLSISILGSPKTRFQSPILS